MSTEQKARPSSKKGKGKAKQCSSNTMDIDTSNHTKCSKSSRSWNTSCHSPQSKVTISFKVPQPNGCVDSIEIDSNIPYDNFRHRLSESMDISARKLNIGYTLSTWLVKEPLSVLSKVSHLVGLFENVLKEEARLKKARKKGNNTKELYVKIKDLNETKGAKSKATGKKSKVCSPPSSIAALRAANNRGWCLGKENERQRRFRCPGWTGEERRRER